MNLSTLVSHGWAAYIPVSLPHMPADSSKNAVFIASIWRWWQIVAQLLPRTNCGMCSSHSNGNGSDPIMSRFKYLI